MTAGSRSLAESVGPTALAIFVWLLVVLPGLASGGKTPSANETVSTFKLQCSSCHGQNGAGDTSIGKNLKAADLRSSEVQKQSDAQLAQVIGDGRRNMPSFSNSLSPDQIRALVAYIRKLAKSQK